ncbi:MAG: hypothetical protein RPU59_09545, partial [Candidatus Sedimenticola sp. (ex Thyasira tokunagai)]
ESELPATLLSTDEDELTALLELFDDEQLSLLSGESQKLLDGCDDVPERAKLRLQQIVQASEAR